MVWIHQIPSPSTSLLGFPGTWLSNTTSSPCPSTLQVVVISCGYLGCPCQLLQHFYNQFLRKYWHRLCLSGLGLTQSMREGRIKALAPVSSLTCQCLSTTLLQLEERVRGNRPASGQPGGQCTDLSCTLFYRSVKKKVCFTYMTNFLEDLSCNPAAPSFHMNTVSYHLGL